MRPSALRLEARLVAPDERADVVGHIEELGAPLLVKRYREAQLDPFADLFASSAASLWTSLSL